MRPRSLLVLVAVVISLFALVALAQPKKGAKDAAKETDDKAAAAKNGDKATDKAADKAPDKTEKAEAAPAAAGDSYDLGEAPPKPAPGQKAETKLSPLNPAANEFPDGGVTAPPVEYDRLLGDIAAL